MPTPPGQGTTALASACHDAALRGEFGGMGATLEALRAAGTPEATLWMHALHAVTWLADPRRGRLPSRAELAPAAELAGPVRAIAALACAHCERAAVIAFDATQLASWTELHERLRHDAPADPMLIVARAWCALLAGRTDTADALATEAGRGAAAARLPAVVIESTALRGLAATARRDLDAATTLARRASRMARTEGLPQSQYLANLVLARVRRLSGKPALATRILVALLRVAPTPWLAWLGWELVLARGEQSDESNGAMSGLRSGASMALESLQAMLDAARAGDRVAYEAAANVAHAHASEFVEARRDIERLIALTDVSAPISDCDHDIASFCRGETSTVPDGLYGASEAMRIPTVGWVLSEPGQPGRRFLSLGLRLVGHAVQPEDLEPSRQLRTDSAIAALGLAGPDGYREDAFFASLYGFAYIPENHKGVRDVLYHRIRQRLASSAALVREDDRVRVVANRRVVLPDPRCSPPEEHSLLQVLAAGGHMSAKGASQALGIPVRTVRRALDRLAEEGACQAEKRGGRVRYYLEDTTFSEPTDF